MLEDDIVLADILSTGGIVTTGQVIDWTRTHLEGPPGIHRNITMGLDDILRFRATVYMGQSLDGDKDPLSPEPLLSLCA
ncbi:hypothetical protein FRC18_006673 [Serendipita sp. 400]|nr:hypothetical protein FRC18_006673 [Serendipita sp. 400]